MKVSSQSLGLGLEVRLRLELRLGLSLKARARVRVKGWILACSIGSRCSVKVVFHTSSTARVRVVSLGLGVRN